MTKSFVPERMWDYENGYFLTAREERFSKFLAHYELFKMAKGLAGCLAEFGVFKGASLSRWCAFRSLLANNPTLKILAFDTFGSFPSTAFEGDKEKLSAFLEAAGDTSITLQDMQRSLAQRGFADNIDLIEGDICQTLPDYLERHPETKFSLVNLDTDIYEPAACIIENVWSRIVPNGILVLDDYGVFPGETKAVDDFFDKEGISPLIEKFPFSATPVYIRKP